MSEHDVPTVGIGLPVYNGERYLAECIESVLAQSFGDFRLFISDDASTDGSAEICRAYAVRDARVAFRQQPRNRGVAPNFQAVFEASNSPYFKWLGQDDWIAPDFLAVSLAMLRDRPDAVLCYSAIDMIGPDGVLLAHEEARLPGAECDQASKRFGQVVVPYHDCRAMHGLLRTAAIRRCLPFWAYATADQAVLAEMALLGSFVYVPQPIHRIRDHSERYSRKVYYDRSAIARAWGSGRTTRFGLHFWIHVLNYARIVARSQLGPSERLRCYGHLLAWFGMKRNQIGLAMDLIALADPRLEVALRRAKYRVHEIRQSAL